MIKTILLILVLALPIAANPCETNYVELRNIVTRMGWRVTSEMGGGHNAHSRHYVGKAIDVSVRGKSEFNVIVLEMVIKNAGYNFRDERKRPKGQRVWGGAHIHLSVPYCK